MSTELGILALYGIVVIATLAFRALARLTSAGLAARLSEASVSSLAAMALFAPAVLTLGQLDRLGGLGLVAAQGFLGLRLAYLPLQALGARRLARAASGLGFASILALYLLAL